MKNSGMKRPPGPLDEQKHLGNGCKEGIGMTMHFERKLFIAIAAVAITLALFSLVLTIGG